MGKRGISEEIKEEFLAGKSREYLNLKYNKGTVTKIYNQLHKLNMLPYEKKETVKKVNDSDKDKLKKINNEDNISAEHKEKNKETVISNKVDKKYEIKNLKSNYENDKSQRIEELLVEMFKLLNKNNEYEINISIKSKKDLSVKEEILDPFELYDKVGKEIMIKQLSCMSEEYLIKIIRKNFKDNVTNFKKLNSIELAKYISEQIENVLDIGKCFR